jgi:hypothetical protein
MILTLLRVVMLIGVLPLGIWLALLLRKRGGDAACSHRWTAPSADGPWTCEWCGAVESTCPHETWQLPSGAEAWSCRSCGTLTGHVAVGVGH